jgi:hypothetical protein
MMEAQAHPVPGADEQSLRFMASIPFSFQKGQKLTMAVRLIADGVTFWDNNGGENYITPVGSALKKIHTSLNQFLPVDVGGF